MSNSLSPDNSVFLQTVVTNPVDGTFINDATVKVNIYDADNVLVAGVWPQTLVYVAASDGTYRITLDPIAGLVVGDLYRVQFFSTNPSLLLADCDIKVRATDRICAEDNEVFTSPTNYESRITVNEAGIATNTTNIATNTTNIATNVTDIATNVTDIATNVTDIANLDSNKPTQELTVALMAAHTNKTYVAGDFIDAAEYFSGTGGGGRWKAVLTSSVTPNTFNIVVGTGIAANQLISFVLQTGKILNALQWGCVGDWNGSTGTDNLLAIQHFFDNTPPGSTAWFPYTKYRSTQTVTAPNNIDIQMDGILIYDGAVTSGALVIGDSASSIIRQKLVLKVWNKEQIPGSWTNTSHIGIQIWHANTCEIHLRQYIGFTIGCVFQSQDGIGTGYNSVYLGMSSDNKIGLRLYGTVNGWVNENKFFGGRFSVDSSTHVTLDRLGIEILGDGSYVHNSNVFYGFACELSFAGTNDSVLASITDGAENQFLQYRNENNDSPEVNIIGVSRDNVFMSSFGQVNINDTSTQPSTIAIGSRDLVKAYTRASWNSGHLGRLATNYNGASAEYMLPTCDMWATAPSIQYGGYSLANNDYIETTAARGVGRAFDTTFAKKWLVRRNVVSGFGGRIRINAYDSSGVLLTGTSPAYVTGRDGSVLTYDSGFGGGYGTGGDAEADQYFNLHDDVHSIDVLIVSGTAHIKLKSFEVIALDMQQDKAITAFFRSTRPEEEERFGTAIPTLGTYPKGTKIWQITPVSAAPMGFTCSVAGAPGTWLSMSNFA